MSAPPSTTTSSTEDLPDRVPVRLKKVAPYTAVRVRVLGVVDLADGQKVPVAPGDWLITVGSQTLRTLSAAAFADSYEAVDEGGLRLSPVQCRALEDRLGPGSTAAAAALQSAVERLAHLSIGGVEVPFTPGQLEELRFRATKRGRTLEQELQAVVDRVKDELFWGTAAKAAQA